MAWRRSSRTSLARRALARVPTASNQSPLVAAARVIPPTTNSQIGVISTLSTPWEMATGSMPWVASHM
ncbi:hypothetical protein [Serinicoccus sp. CUA-874]|uniref:hypothetical protein n=1 Tax=Serinicoccus sp. CUA-874 TaxID=1517939 RepID=UPI00117B5D1E|nr:hypothetical protein [Serinicoccus sp. CUA-874]